MADCIFFLHRLFTHGEKAAESNGSFYRLHHEKIYKVNSADEELTLNEEHHPINAKPIDLSIAKMFCDVGSFAFNFLIV